MNRADTIRNMTDEQLAEFLKCQENLGLPDISFRCWFYCPDYRAGCFYKCPRNQGEEFRQQWLHEECGDFSHMQGNFYTIKKMEDILNKVEPESPEPDSLVELEEVESSQLSSFASAFFKKSQPTSKFNLMEEDDNV